MTDIDLDKLEALADAAIHDPTYDGRSFEAAANPATIKSLIASAREAAAEIDRLRAREADDTLAFKMIDVGQSAVPDHWRFRCDARKIAQMRLMARAAQIDGEG